MVWTKIIGDAVNAPDEWGRWVLVRIHPAGQAPHNVVTTGNMPGQASNTAARRRTRV
jgi:hypothetical protein